MPDNSHFLSVQSLECIRDDRVLFSELSFTAEPGELVQIDGGNGSGKTSLLRLMANISQAENGEIRWRDKPVQQQSSYTEEFLFIGHNAGIKSELTPLENLRFFQSLGYPDGLDARTSLERMGLAGYEDTPCNMLSAGQKRRVALARLLTHKALLWILDEPFTAIDKHGTSLIRDLLTQHCLEGGIVILTTHQPAEFDNIRVKRIHLNA